MNTMTETRAEKAQRLVDEGRVKLLGYLYPYTSARVQGEHSNYETTLFPSGNYVCNCSWGLAHWYGRDFCVHALAVKLAAEKEVGDGL